MVLKLYFLYDNTSTSLSNEYSTVHENIALNYLADVQWPCVFLLLALSASPSACPNLILHPGPRLAR